MSENFIFIISSYLDSSKSKKLGKFPSFFMYYLSVYVCKLRYRTRPKLMSP